MSNSQDFFPDPLGDYKPEKPEKIPDYDDYEDKEYCLSCGKQFAIHSTRDIVQCALNELRGEKT